MSILTVWTAKIRLWWSTHKSIVEKIALYVFMALVFIGTIKLCTPKPKPSDFKDQYPVITQYRDENKQLVSKINQAEVEKTKDLMIDSLANALKISRKNIKTVDHYITKTDTVFKDNIEYIKGDDSTIITRKDNYVNIFAVGKSQGSYIRYNSIDTITRVEEHKNPLFGTPSTTVYLRSSNPYNSITNGSSFTIREKRPYLTIGPSLQYNPFNNQFNVGISAQIPIFTFKK